VFVHELNETLARCRSLYFDETGRVRTKERGRQLQAGIDPLISPRASAAERTAFAQLTFIGWCWRAAERGDKSRLRDALRRAFDAVTADGSAPPHLVPAWVAWRFRTDGGLPALASPGAADLDRIAFLDDAFAKIHATYGEPAGIDFDRARAAFDHGVMVHDAELLLETA